MITVVHKHFAFGTAPFKFVGIWSTPSKNLMEVNPSAYDAAIRARPTCCHFACDHCGTGIGTHCIIIDAEGKKFAVGSDCVAKTDHIEVLSAVKLALKEQAKAARGAKREAVRLARQAAYDAVLQSQRDVNGGLTDNEVIAQAALVARQANLAITGDLVEILCAAGGDFCYSIAQNYRNGSAPRGRAKDIVIEIVAKQSGRKGSKAYAAALEAAEQMVESIEKALK